MSKPTREFWKSVFQYWAVGLGLLFILRVSHAPDWCWFLWYIGLVICGIITPIITFFDEQKAEKGTQQWVALGSPPHVPLYELLGTLEEGYGARSTAIYAMALLCSDGLTIARCEKEACSDCKTPGRFMLSVLCRIPRSSFRGIKIIPVGHDAGKAVLDGLGRLAFNLTIGHAFGVKQKAGRSFRAVIAIQYEAIDRRVTLLFGIPRSTVSLPVPDLVDSIVPEVAGMALTVGDGLVDMADISIDSPIPGDVAVAKIYERILVHMAARHVTPA